MYPKKAKYLRSIYPEKECVSAITTTMENNTLIGTPCILCIKPFGIKSLINPLITKLSFSDKLEDSGKEKITSKETELISAKDLCKMSITEANGLIYRYVHKLKALFIFNTSNNYNDFYTYNLYGKHVYFTGVKPIILDECKHFDVIRLSDVHSKKDINNFAEMTYSSLQDHRYINYTFTNIAKSNKKYMIEDINTIFNSLGKAYPYNLSTFYSLLDGVRDLIDVISISFYKLTDVTAIFDSRRAVGMGVDVYLTNSLCTVKDMGKSGKSMTYRFLFSTSEENIFNIDGEMIHRPSSHLTKDVLSAIYSVITKNIPNDEAIKEKKTKICRR